MKIAASGILTLNEVVNLVMKEPRRPPTVEVGRRMKVHGELVKRVRQLRPELREDDDLARLLDQGEPHDIKTLGEAIARLPISSPAEINSLCVEIGSVLKDWRSYDQTYALALTSVLGECRSGALTMFASTMPQRGAPTRCVPIEELMADITIDVDRRHLIPARHGELYARRKLGVPDESAFFNVKLGYHPVKKRLVGIRKTFNSTRTTTRPPLRISRDVEHWYKLHSKPFRNRDIPPTEEQLTLALALEWPDHTNYRGVGRALTRTLWARPRGRPVKNPA